MRIKWIDVENGSQINYEELDFPVNETLTIHEARREDEYSKWLYPGDRTRAGNESSRSFTVSGEGPQFNCEGLTGTFNKGTVKFREVPLTALDRTYRFSYKLAAELPYSLDGKYGTIGYKAKAVVMIANGKTSESMEQGRRWADCYWVKCQIIRLIDSH